MKLLLEMVGIYLPCLLFMLIVFYIIRHGDIIASIMFLVLPISIMLLTFFNFLPMVSAFCTLALLYHTKIKTRYKLFNFIKPVCILGNVCYIAYLFYNLFYGTIL